MNHYYYLNLYLCFDLFCYFRTCRSLFFHFRSVDSRTDLILWDNHFSVRFHIYRLGLYCIIQLIFLGNFEVGQNVARILHSYVLLYHSNYKADTYSVLFVFVVNNDH
eukprot:UN23256